MKITLKSFFSQYLIYSNIKVTYETVMPELYM